MHKSTLTSKGQVTVPKAVRERLGVDTGDVLVWSFNDDGSVRVSTPERQISKLKGIIDKPKRKVTLEEINNAR